MTAPVNPGDVIAGKYRIDRVVGAGGMGVVVAATHVALQQRVAIKFLLPEVIASPTVAVRFAREAQVAAKLRSEHVARIMDVSALENGLPYLVMEYLEGRSLDQILQEQATLSVDETVDFMLQALEAIAEAHSLGIVHRDLKPANMFIARHLDGSPTVKVIDFGISKVIAGEQIKLTTTTTQMGSPLYMSPEQMRSGAVDERADIWAIGIVLYEMLAGQAPFMAETLPQVITLVLTEPPRPLALVRPGLPEGLEAVILRCLAKDREARFANVSQLALALREFAPERSRTLVERVTKIVAGAGTTLVSDRPPLPPLLAFAPLSPRASVPLAPPRHGATASSWTTQPPPKARRHTLVAVAGAACLLGAIGTAAWLVRGRASSPSSSTGTSAPSLGVSVSAVDRSASSAGSTSTPAIAPSLAVSAVLVQPATAPLPTASAVAPWRPPVHGAPPVASAPSPPSDPSSPSTAGRSPSPSGTAAFGGRK